jgi:hypothetical protein
MQLLPMYLALFFGTLLATTTDAAPRGFKKDDDVHSLGRIRMLKTGKHAAITTTAAATRPAVVTNQSPRSQSPRAVATRPAAATRPAVARNQSPRTKSPKAVATRPDLSTNLVLRVHAQHARSVGNMGHDEKVLIDAQWLWCVRV